MFEYYKKIDSLNHVNRVLLVLLGALLLLNAWLSFALMQAPKKMEFWLSPSMSASGGIIKPEAVPDEYVHGFVTSLIPVLNSWTSAGETEFYNHIEGLSYYFTPRFRDLMAKTKESLQRAGLFSRTQTASLYRFLEEGDVKRIGKDAWEVHLLLRISQKLNEQSAMVIADKVVDYHFRVVKVNLSKIQNPFGLAIDGYTKPERLAQDLLAFDAKREKA